MFDINDYDHTIFTYNPNLDYLEEIPKYLCEIFVKLKAELQAFLLIAGLLADKLKDRKQRGQTARANDD